MLLLRRALRSVSTRVRWLVAAVAAASAVVAGPCAGDAPAGAARPAPASRVRGDGPGATSGVAPRPDAGLLQLPHAQGSALQFSHLGVENGLPSSLVSDVVQDHRGFMWVGTGHGVSRFDGGRFRTYARERANPYSLPLDFIDQVYEDRAGTLWVVTRAGLSRYDAAHDGFVTYAAQHVARDAATGAHPITTTALDDSRGAFWVGTSAGLYRLDRATGVAAAVPLGTPAVGGAAPARPHVMAIHEDARQRVWVGTRAGLYLLGPDGRAARYYGSRPGDVRGLPDSVVRAFADGPDGALWIGTGDGGLARLDERTGHFERFRHDPADTTTLAKNRIVRLVADRAGGGLWAGTENGGLDYFDFATRQFVHHRFDPNVPSSIGSNSIWALYQDATGALWVGTFSGGLDVSAPNGAAIHQYRSVSGDTGSLSYNAVPAFAEDRAGYVWVATDGGGLNRFDPRTGRFARFTQQNTNLNAEAVLGALEDRRGELWVATWGGGISRFDRRARRFTPYTTANSDIPDDHVYELLEDRAGRLWVGTENAMVAQFDPTRGTFPRRFRVVAPGLAPSSVLLLRELGDGTLGVGLREGGVATLDPRTGARRYYVADPHRPDGLASNDVRALLADGPGAVWVGTEDGLDRLDLATGRCTHYGEADGLPSAFVEGLAPDAGGRLWVSTDRGLARFDPLRRTAKVYTRADGLHGDEFLMRSAFRASDGALYFGGNAGFSVVRPAWLVENRRPPPVVITGLQLFNRPVAVGTPGSPLRRAIDQTTELTLTHAQNVVTFEFAALDFGAAANARYAYRLDGFDAEWQHVGRKRTASYTNLAPGRYTFRVRASNGDGVWNTTGATLALVVTPPTWQTWWFRLLAASALLAGVYRLLRFQQRRRIEVALGRQALRDPLTGLANRALFRDRAAHALARVARDGTPAGTYVAVLFLDLDNFKTVNDSLGHHAGDRLLRAVADRLLNATRGCDTGARLGGDEFAVLLENARGAVEAHTVAERIAHALQAPVPVGEDGSAAAGREARVGVSVGIAFAEPGVEVDALLRNADLAMYRAKAEGKGRHAVFDPALVAAAADRLQLENDLARALAGDPEGGEFALVYQPIVRLTTGEVTGAEALVRWRHPARGLVGPVQFIPLAEASGQIVPLGRWVLDEACRTAAAWPLGADGAPVGVTVNVSGRQLVHPDLRAHVAGALERAGLDPARLTLEITESVLMHDTDAALAVLRALKALGVHLAVDDFGTGYSSLRYLQQFPVDVLKIDKSFVDGVARGPQEAALARTIVALGETLGLRTVAEGVEEEAQRVKLLEMGCAFGQGYLFARPLAEADLRARLTADHLVLA